MDINKSSPLASLVSPKLSITLKELEKAKNALDEFKISPQKVERRQVFVDLSEPSAVNKWINQMRCSQGENEMILRPAGVTAQIRYYNKNQNIKFGHNIYEFHVSSKNRQAAKTKLLNYECRTRVKTTIKVAYRTLEYSKIIEAIRSDPQEVKKFAKNVLRLIKGTSFRKIEKGLTGLKKTRDCSLDFVAILLTSECLRDPRSKYLAISEFYKLKRGEIYIDDLFHPLYGRYIPARIKEKKFLEKYRQDWPESPTNKSNIVLKKTQGGAQQMRALKNQQIKEHFYDKEMQAIYERHVKPYYKEKEEEKMKTIDRIKKNCYDSLKKLQTEENDLAQKYLDECETQVKEIMVKHQSPEIQKEKIEEIVDIFNKEIGKNIDVERKEQSQIISKSRDAIQKLEDEINSLCFSKWVEKKFKKAYSIVTAISNEESEVSTSYLKCYLNN